MDILTRNGVKYDFGVAYLGLLKKWISSKDLADAAYNQQFIYLLDEQTIIKIEILKYDEPALLDFIVFKKNNLKYSENTDYIKKVWSIAFLNEIYRKNISIDEKLNEIEQLWTDMDYPADWESFISFLPSKNRKSSSKEDIYADFLHYLDHLKTIFKTFIVNNI